MNKEEYIKPTIQVFAITQRNFLLAGSGRSVNSLTGDTFTWDNELEDDEVDM